MYTLGNSWEVLLEANDQMRMIAKQQALMANHQVMMQAPGELRQKYFDEVYAESILAATVAWKKKQGKLSCVQEKPVQKRMVEETDCDDMGNEEIDSEDNSSKETVPK